jgi:hypothetical protein
LQEELEVLKSPPFMPATILEVGENAIRLSLDGGGIYEIPLNKKLKQEIRRGIRVILNPMEKSIVGYSEFTSSNGEIVTVEGVLNDRLKVNVKGELFVVFNSVEGVKPGDEVMLDSSKTLAVERFSRKKNKICS